MQGMQQGAVVAAAAEGSGAQPSLWEPPRGSSTHVKTVDVEFKELEFIDPSRMVRNSVYRGVNTKPAPRQAVQVTRALLRTAQCSSRDATWRSE